MFSIHHMKSLFFLVGLFLSAPFVIFSQKNEELIQFSGSVYTASRDSLSPVPYVLVKNKSRQSGAYSNFDGFFSVVVERGDTLEFSSIGFKKRTLIVPDNIKNSKFFVSQIIMIRDTNSLPEIIIVPWKNVDELKKAFVELKLNEDDIVRAYQNLQLEKWKEMSSTVAYEGAELQKTTLIQQNQRNLQLQGLQPANNLINPIAWMQFIEYLRTAKKTKPKSSSDGRFEDTGK